MNVLREIHAVDAKRTASTGAPMDTGVAARPRHEAHDGERNHKEWDRMYGEPESDGNRYGD